MKSGWRRDETVITKLWRWLFGGCEHEWKDLRQSAIGLRCCVSTASVDVVGHHYEQQCTKCQRVRFFNTNYLSRS